MPSLSRDQRAPTPLPLSRWARTIRDPTDRTIKADLASICATPLFLRTALRQTVGRDGRPPELNQRVAILVVSGRLLPLNRGQLATVIRLAFLTQETREGRRRMKPAAREGTITSPGLAWPLGDFYLPGFALTAVLAWYLARPMRIGGFSLHAPQSCNQNWSQRSQCVRR